MVDQIEQLKAMREEAQKRIEQKRELIKKQMHALAVSADAKLIKSLSPLIENLEKSLVNVGELQKAETEKAAAVQQAFKPSLVQSDIAPKIKTRSAAHESLEENLQVEQTAENALAAALNQSGGANAQVAPIAPMAPIAPVAQMAPIQLHVDQTPVRQTSAERTQTELEKIAAQLRETISQGRTV